MRPVAAFEKNRQSTHLYSHKSLPAMITFQLAMSFLPSVLLLTHLKLHGAGERLMGYYMPALVHSKLSMNHRDERRSAVVLGS